MCLIAWTCLKACEPKADIAFAIAEKFDAIFGLYPEDDGITVYRPGQNESVKFILSRYCLDAIFNVAKEHVDFYFELRQRDDQLLPVAQGPDGLAIPETSGKRDSIVDFTSSNASRKALLV